MSDRGGPATRLGPRIAAVLRAGTLVAVAAIATGWVVALVARTERPGARPIGEVIAGGGPDALTSIGLLMLTLLPLGVLAVAAQTFRADGERRYLVASVVTLVLLGGSLLVAALVLAPG